MHLWRGKVIINDVKNNKEFVKLVKETKNWMHAFEKDNKRNTSHQVNDGVSKKKLILSSTVKEKERK